MQEETRFLVMKPNPITMSTYASVHIKCELQYANINALKETIEIFKTH